MQPIILCDFDGTITTSDNIVAIMEQFAPETSAPIKEAVLQGKMAIKDGVSQMFQLLETTQKQAIIDFLLDSVQIRAGFEELLAYTTKNAIPFYVVSGGIDFFVEPILEKFPQIDGIYCNGSDFSSKHITVTYPYPCDKNCVNQHCGCCKPTIMRKLTTADDFVIAIGDSVTDYALARQADFVFACDKLLNVCQNENLPHQAFTTFYEVVALLEERLDELQK